MPAGMLRFAEEIVLLMLDDEGGRFVSLPEPLLRCALAGAVLMDLALENRIDTDLKRLLLIDATPVGDELLDPTLNRIAQEPATYAAVTWVERVAEDAGGIRKAVLRRLVERGILRQREERFLWVFRSRRYPKVDGKVEREVKLRIMGVLFSEEIPEPRDIVIMSLANACGLLGEILGERELHRARERIKQVSRLDLIGQAVAKAVWEIERSIALVVQAEQ